MNKVMITNRKGIKMCKFLQAVMFSTALISSTAYPCTSDYDCGIGKRCVKSSYEYSGYCARAVNEYGDTAWGAKRRGILETGTRQCYGSSDCPGAFRCKSGQCVK